MSEASEHLGFLASYWGFAFGLAASFYAGISWFGRHHLSQDSKDTLTLWLWGEYESTWSHHFCNMFDAVFGNRHLSWQCFIRSSIASLLTVALLYVFFAHVLGVMGVERARALGDLDFWHAVVFGAAINIVPDYLSLFETRWLLKRFERVRSVPGQLGVLLADGVFSGAIIWLGINAFRFIWGEPALSAIEMLALFSVFSLFFYSTFLTSVWAWTFCISTWFMRLFSRTPLKNILDVENRPVAQVALVSSALIFVSALLLAPILKMDEQNRTTVFDNSLCAMFPADACPHVARVEPDDQKAQNILAKTCQGGTVEHCVQEATTYFSGDVVKVFQLWRKACAAGEAAGCSALAWMYHNGIGVTKDETKAVHLYRRACKRRHALGCENLNKMYNANRGVTAL